MICLHGNVLLGFIGLVVGQLKCLSNERKPIVEKQLFYGKHADLEAFVFALFPPAMFLLPISDGCNFGLIGKLMGIFMGSDCSNKEFISHAMSPEGCSGWRRGP